MTPEDLKKIEDAAELRKKDPNELTEEEKKKLVEADALVKIKEA